MSDAATPPPKRKAAWQYVPAFLHEKPEGLVSPHAHSIFIPPEMREAHETALFFAVVHEKYTELLYLERLYRRYGDALISDAVCYEAAFKASASKNYLALKIIAAFAPVENWRSEKEHLAYLIVEKGDEKALSILLEAGLDVNTPRSRNGIREPNLLGTASVYGKTEILKMLHAHGADLEARDGSNRTALMMALHNDQVTAAGFLFDMGADTQVTDARGNTLLHYLKLLPEAHVEKLLASKLDFDAENDKGITPFLAGAGALDKPILEVLLTKGVNPLHQDKRGNNAAHYTWVSDDGQRFSYLQTLGVPVDAPNHAQMTPILEAAEFWRWGHMKILAELGAELHRNHPEKMLSPFHILLDALAQNEMSDWEFIDIDGATNACLQAGQDIYLPDKSGISPLDYAEQFRKEASSDQSSQMRQAIGAEIETWPNRCRAHWQEALEQPLTRGFFLDGDKPTLAAKQLAGAGILQEAFLPSQWRGREGEALEIVSDLLQALPDFQRARYEQWVDTSLLSYNAPSVTQAGFANKEEQKKSLLPKVPRR